jgi:hypothetical protein
MLVMSSGVETSRFNKNADEASARNSQRFLDFARNDKNDEVHSRSAVSIP